MGTSETSHDGVRALRDDSFDAAVDTGALVLVEFFTEWCGTCTRMDPTLESVAADTDAAVLKVDIEEHLETAIEYGARSSPTFVLFADGRPVKQLRGGQTEATLRDLVDRYAE